VIKGDDCCMTSTKHNGVYVFGKLKPNAKQEPKADAKRLEAAKKNLGQYLKK